MPDWLDYASRCQAIDGLDAAAAWLNAAAVRLDAAGAKAAAGLAEDAAVKLAAACWILAAPIREHGPPPYGPPRWPAEADGRR